MEANLVPEVALYMAYPRSSSSMALAYPYHRGVYPIPRLYHATVYYCNASKVNETVVKQVSMQPAKMPNKLLLPVKNKH